MHGLAPHSTHVTRILALDLGKFTSGFNCCCREKVGPARA